MKGDIIPCAGCEKPFKKKRKDSKRCWDCNYKRYFVKKKSPVSL